MNVILQKKAVNQLLTRLLFVVSTIEEEKKIDWIEEGLASDDEMYGVIESVDYWGFYAEHLWNTLRSEVSIEEREVHNKMIKPSHGG